MITLLVFIWYLFQVVFTTSFEKSSENWSRLQLEGERSAPEGSWTWLLYFCATAELELRSHNCSYLKMNRWHSLKTCKVSKMPAEFPCEKVVLKAVRNFLWIWDCKCWYCVTDKNIYHLAAKALMWKTRPERKIAIKILKSWKEAKWPVTCWCVQSVTAKKDSHIILTPAPETTSSR